jgi:hypothetical protein
VKAPNRPWPGRPVTADEALDQLRADWRTAAAEDRPVIERHAAAVHILKAGRVA